MLWNRAVCQQACCNSKTRSPIASQTGLKRSISSRHQMLTSWIGPINPSPSATTPNPCRFEGLYSRAFMDRSCVTARKPFFGGYREGYNAGSLICPHKKTGWLPPGFFQLEVKIVKHCCLAPSRCIISKAPDPTATRSAGIITAFPANAPPTFARVANLFPFAKRSDVPVTQPGPWTEARSPMTAMYFFDGSPIFCIVQWR